MPKVKLYIGNIRLNTRITELIKANEERVIIEYGQGQYNYNESERATTNPTIWIEEVYNELKTRDLEIINRKGDLLKITVSKMILEMAEEYIKQNKKEAKHYDQINHMRLYKQMILPIELVDYTGRIVSEAYEKDECKSVLK